MLSRRERLILLCQHNAAFLQEQFEETLGVMPWAAQTGILWVLKSKSNGEITFPTLWKLPSFILTRFIDDEGFEQLWGTVMVFLQDL